jgi:hypothetical protein
VVPPQSRSEKVQSLFEGVGRGFELLWIGSEKFREAWNYFGEDLKCLREALKSFWLDLRDFREASK